MALSDGQLPWQWPKELEGKLRHDPETLSLASTDYGNIVHEKPLAVFYPSSIADISLLIKFSNSLPTPFTIAARGQAHSVDGQAMALNGVVVNMTELNNYRNGSGIVVSEKENYADVGGEQIWIDLLHAALQHGLTPLSWTDYLYLTVGGTLSNAGISGQTFLFGPQISNVHELDVITGKGDLVTCSAGNNSELFNAVLGGLGQFGIITRARIALGPAPTRANMNWLQAKWLRLVYRDFSAFSGDQEQLISLNGKSPDYLEGHLLLNKPPLDLSFYPPPDHPRISSLLTQDGILYILELAKYYDNHSHTIVDKEVEELLSGLKFVPTFKFERDVSYEDFLNRVPNEERALRSQARWDLPHPWLSMFVPKSRISDFDQGVLKDILLKQNLTAQGLELIFPINRNKWDDRMSAVTPDEDVFYAASLLQSSVIDHLEDLENQNNQILQFCKDSGIQVKLYLHKYKSQEEWMEHFGPKWKKFQQMKAEFDPRKLLSPGQEIFTN
ncbi:hypothetical protein L6164_011738 [Bauhinia variegata]|uniref:Uncharacterized protein n=1 Tax=Bauhinia variegata TaxID=167791 RepID=A0ACB9PAQ3_BAUVA|nr:hypothetical protein L6164_011738 [Bauhinia variegata]